MKLLILNGPNLNLLGLREPEIYGKTTYKDLTKLIKAHAEKEGVTVRFYQSNYEGALVTKIQRAKGRFDGIVINPGAYTHTSIALLDALKAASLPTIEVHISDPDTREEFRKTSYIRAACLATVKGKGLAGYTEAITLLKEKLS